MEKDAPYLHEPTWKAVLKPEFKKQYLQDLFRYVDLERKTNHIFPTTEHVFKAFNLCPYDKVKVVILGQDPYHGENQATGLAFSVPQDVRTPPSLKNIFKEIYADVGGQMHTDGDLTYLASQGVLLLNSILTVSSGKPGSHKERGWEQFTNHVIQTISDQKEHVVFMLWGDYAKKKGACINTTKHLVLETTHPSPFSAHKGFLGSRHFSKANEYLVTHGKEPIQWS